MKKIIVCLLTCFMTISANATNWVEIANNQKEYFYIDTDSVKITSENYQMLTAFFKGTELNSKGKKFDFSRYHMTINCRNRSLAIKSYYSYDSNGKVIDSYDSGMSFNPAKEAHPGTLSSSMVDSACDTGGFSR